MVYLIQFVAHSQFSLLGPNIFKDSKFAGSKIKILPYIIKPNSYKNIKRTNNKIEILKS